MAWFGLIFLLILLSHSLRARQEPKDLQLLSLAPHLFNPSNPAQRLMIKRNLENCNAPICQMAQKYLSSEFEPVNKNSLSKRRAEGENVTTGSTEAPKNTTVATPVSVKKCDHCQGPHCNCRQSHVPLPFRSLCEKNGDSPPPDLTISIVCWIMDHEQSFRNIAVEVSGLLADLMTLLPFGDFILPGSFLSDLFSNPALDTHKPSSNSNPSKVPEYPSPQQNYPNYPQPPSSPNFPNPFNPSPQNPPSYPQPPKAPEYPSRPEPMNPPYTPNRPSYPQPPSPPNQPNYPQPPSIPNSPNPPNQPSYPQQPNIPNSPNPPNYPSAPNQNYPNYPQNPVAPGYPPAPSPPSYNQPFNSQNNQVAPGAPAAQNQDSQNPFSAFRPFFSRS